LSKFEIVVLYLFFLGFGSQLFCWFSFGPIGFRKYSTLVFHFGFELAFHSTRILRRILVLFFMGFQSVLLFGIGLVFTDTDF
jgi:hypothetical protein